MTLPVAPTRGRTAFGLGGAVLLLVGTAVAVPAATLPVVGLVAALLAVPLLRALAEGAAWSLPLLVSVVVLLADVGGRTIGSGPWRYVATIAVVLTIVLVGMRPDARSRALRITAAVLFLYGLLGTLYGRTVLGTANGALPLVGPLLIACLPAVRDWGAVPRWRLGLRVVAGAGAVFALFSALSRLG
ncbi:MAG TPA: hypothetical protein VHF92_15655, partial [Geodermatophilus sp.]|nr:hypothetical protein [Geodermatophilus sp.]